MLVRRLLAATTVAVAGVGVVLTSAPATAAASKCVALVVDFSHVGGSVSSACVTAPTTATGSDVLLDGHHKVTFDPRYGNDFVCAIDDVPAGGCHATDGTHYWVYYHRRPAGTSWQLSQEGAGTFKPANTSTEGWVYDNGGASAPAPRDVPYSAICKSTPKTASPTPSPTSTTRTSATATPATTAARHVRVAPAPVRRTPSTAAQSPTVSASATSRQVQPVASLDGRHQRTLHRVPWALLVGVVAAAGLGAAAVVRLRRRTG